jgi:hypothetical protein
MERPAVLAGSDFLFRLPGLFAGQIGGNRDEGVEGRVETRDPFQEKIRKLDRGDFSFAEQGGDFGNGQILIVFEIHRGFPFVPEISSGRRFGENLFAIIKRSGKGCQMNKAFKISGFASVLLLDKREGSAKNGVAKNSRGLK